MNHDFIYALRMNPTLACDLQNAQLKSDLSAEAGTNYHLNTLLSDKVIIARSFPGGFNPLMVGLAFLEQIDGRTYFNVHQIPNGKLTIVPQVTIDLADTQFNDVTEEVCMGRTIKGAVFSAMSNEDITDLNDKSAFSVIGNTLVFGFRLDTKSKEKTGDRQAFEVFGFGQALGRASIEEVMDDSDVYDDISTQFLAFLKAQQV